MAPKKELVTKIKDLDHFLQFYNENNPKLLGKANHIAWEYSYWCICWMGWILHWFNAPYLQNAINHRWWLGQEVRISWGNQL